jgi:hypothetical protein
MDYISDGTTRSQRRVRITKTKVTKKGRTDEVLPLDPREGVYRDEEVARAKGRA